MEWSSEPLSSIKIASMRVKYVLQSYYGPDSLLPAWLDVQLPRLRDSWHFPKTLQGGPFVPWSTCSSGTSWSQTKRKQPRQWWPVSRNQMRKEGNSIVYIRRKGNDVQGSKNKPKSSSEELCAPENSLINGIQGSFINAAHIAPFLFSIFLDKPGPSQTNEQPAPSTKNGQCSFPLKSSCYLPVMFLTVQKSKAAKIITRRVL